MTTKPANPTPDPKDKDDKQAAKPVAPKVLPIKQVKPNQLPPQMMNAQRMNGGNRAMQSMKSPRKR